ncbi:MAG: ABC-three component system middle component 6 [Paraclostridium sp.]
MNAYNIVNYNYYLYLNETEAVRELIDCFKVNKYQSIDEHILYIAMNIYKILDKPEHIDLIFDRYSRVNNVDLSINLERLLYLALTFLFSLGLVEVSENMVRRIK